MIDWTKPIRTKSGHKARLLGELKNVDNPMVVARLITKPCGESYEMLHRYKRNGEYGEVSYSKVGPLTLENVPEVA